MESKGLGVNIGKTKVMICERDTGQIAESGKWPCSVCRKGVGRNSIFCNDCKSWVHKKCSDVKGSLGSVADFRCRRCKGDARPLDGRPVESIAVGGESLGVVDKFCYLGDVIGAGGGAEESSIARVRSGWKKFRELLSISTSRVLSLAMKGRVFEEFVKCVVLYGSEVWAVKEHDLARLERNDMTMIRWICRVRLRDRMSSYELRGCLGLESIRNAVQKRRLRWFGHVERMNADNWTPYSRNTVWWQH